MRPAAIIAPAIFAVGLALTPLASIAVGGHGPELEESNIDLRDQASLQRGAKYFVNYCMSCHSLQYMRWQRMANDIGISEVDLRKNLLFGDAKPGDMMTNAMRPEDGEKWFGTAIPDLSLVTRWRSSDWVYTYLKSYYTDPSRPYGVNNLVFQDVGMPNPFSLLQGVQEPIIEGHGAEEHVVGVKLVEEGSLSPEEFDNMARDITNFLTYVGEPFKLERQRLGVMVLMFLGVLFIPAYFMKKEFWKDVH